MKKKSVLFIFIISLFLLIAPPATYAATQSVSASKVLERANELNGKTDWNYNKNGVTYCLLFVSDFWSSNHTFPDGKAGLGFTGSYGWYSAQNYCNNFRVSTSMDNIPIGADVFFSSSDGYGHIGIYVGDGKFLNAYGEKIRIDSFYNSPYLGNYWANHYLGWGWHQYVKVDDTPNFVYAVDDISGGTGTIHLSGWVFNNDNITKSIQVHAYIDGGPGSGAAGYAIDANVSRKDVDNVYHCGEYHGFDRTLTGISAGTHTIQLFANDQYLSTNTKIGDYNVTVAADNQPPTITNAKISDITKDGYTVTCNISDNIGVERVEFPTWTSSGWHDDIIWHKGVINGNTVSCRINISEHGNEKDLYTTHIYAYDHVGNYNSIAIEPVLINWTTRNNIVFDGHYYSIYTFDGDYDWDSAKIFCEKLGGHLATITSNEENKAVLDLMLKSGKELAWIGATDKVEEGNWKWINGEAFSYSNWAVNQPDNYNGEQHYSVMWKDGTWDDGALTCGINCFIFEYEKPYIINISNAEITDIDDTGYTVSCTVDSEFPLKNVSFPTWTAKDGQDDIIWYDAEINGNTASYRVNTSEHNNESGLYVTHIYAYDTYGNCYSDTPINRKMHTIIGNPQPSNTVEYNGHRYELYELGGEYEWGYAKYFCEEKGGHLATITSAEENNIIHQLIQSSGNNFLIGGTDKDSEGEWKWITGEPFNYTNWNETQSDNYEDEDYLMMYSNGKWNDCHETLKGFICEYEPIPSLNAKLTKKNGYTIVSVKPQYIDAGNNVVIAAYKNNILTDIQTESYNGEDISTVTFAEYDTIKVMMWKNMASMIPLAKAEILN